jgi:hypothetical protein
MFLDLSRAEGSVSVFSGSFGLGCIGLEPSSGVPEKSVAESLLREGKAVGLSEAANAEDANNMQVKTSAWKNARLTRIDCFSRMK